MSLKTVMHPQTREIMNIETNDDPKWMFNYLHRSGMPFSNPIEETGVVLVAASEEVEEEEEVVIDPEVAATVDMTEETIETYNIETMEDVEKVIEDVQNAYIKKLGKIPNNKKNDIDWLLAKINA